MKRSTAAAVGVPVIALAAAGILYVTTGQRQAVPPTSPAPTHHVCENGHLALPFMGVALNAPVDQAIRSFATAVATQPAIVEIYTPFGHPFQRREATQAAADHAVPFLQLNPRRVRLAAIAAGRYDGYLRAYAAAVKKFRCTVILSFGHEMNGSWYSWGEPRTSPATFVAAWRRIHVAFTAAHVGNVTWAWDPDHAGGDSKLWWPGAAYVDWVGLDGYQRPGDTFWSIFHRQLGYIRGFTTKPVFLAETAVAPGADRVTQIGGLFKAVQQYHLIGLVWFDLDRHEAWRLQGDLAATRAFHDDVQRLGR